MGYVPGSLKSRLALRGKALMYQFCAEYGVAHRNCGKLVVAVDEAGAAKLDGVIHSANYGTIEQVKRSGIKVTIGDAPRPADDRRRRLQRGRGAAALHPRIAAVVDQLASEGIRGRMLYVDDGSSDGTWQALQCIADGDPRVGLLRLSRNFGKEAALTAGLDRVEEGAALILDADGQDPPELIPQFVARWREGYDNIHGTRVTRQGEGWLKRGTAHLFYRLIGRLSKTPIPQDTGDFRLLSPRALAGLRQLRERHRFMKGLFGWVGYAQVAVPYEREARIAGRSKFNFWKLWNFALEGITSFSTAPLRLATYLGVLTALFAFGYGVLDRGQGAAVGRPGRRLADDDGRDPVPGRRATGGAGPDRRIPRPPVHGVQAAPAVPGRQLAAVGSILGPIPWARRPPCVRYGSCSRRKRLRFSPSVRMRP